MKSSALRAIIYVVGFATQRAASYLLVPLVIYSLPPEELNRYGALVSVLALLPTIFSLRLHTAPARLYFDYPDESQQKDLLYTSLVSSLIVALIWTAVIAAVCGLTGIDSLVTESTPWIQATVLLTILGRIVAEYTTTYFRAKGMAVNFLAAMLIEGVGLFLPVMVGIYLKLNLYHVAVASFCISACCGAVYGLILNRRVLRSGKYVRDYAKACYDYAWPTAAHLVSGWAIVQSGRLFGGAWFGADHPGLAQFTLLSFLSIGTGVFFRAIFEALRPEIGNTFAKKNYEAGHRHIEKATMASFVVVGVFFTLFGIFTFGFPHLLPAAFRASPVLFCLSVLAGILDVFTVRGMSFLLALKLSRLQFYCYLVSAIVTLVTMPAFCWMLDVMGLQVAMVLGLGCQAALLNYASYYRITQAIDQRNSAVLVAKPT